MNPEASRDHAALAAALSRTGSALGAAEAHGTLCGLLCAGAAEALRRWLESLQDAGPAIFGDPELSAWHAHAAGALADIGLGFGPLLPDATVPLRLRTAALADWCGGLLGGVGLAGGSTRQPLHPEAVEIPHDLGAISQASFPAVRASEADEQDYAELVEFVRVAVMLLREHLRRPAAEPGPGPGDDG